MRTMITPTTVQVLLAVRNRRRMTLRALESLTAICDVKMQIFLFDDGSTDGTADAVQKCFPDVRVLRGDGNQYWAGGMRAASVEAAKSPGDFVLWINDDVELEPGFLCRLLDAHKQSESLPPGPGIIVGTTVDKCGLPTYGGRIRGGPCSPLKFGLVPPQSDALTECHTLNGNIVLVPRRVADVLGGLTTYFRHGLGDYDYGLRAREIGIAVYVAPGTFGKCERNSQDPKLSWFGRLRAELGVKRHPPYPWLRFCLRHGGLLGPLQFVRPYLSAIVAH